ncbi:hypothetical protein [Desulfonatronum thioautotrophicum]|uniref:hypothetical protein n=1 Tax=Desulfonatronum thioautotrophicum TaxID=617001 RepID=UPI0005EAD20A|nr:hypothetical protein [Desulfonatronum thioautotrophicum]
MNIQKTNTMIKSKKQRRAEFVQWMGPLLDVLRELGDTKREVNREGAPHVELIDGNRLVTMLEKEEIGVVPRMVYDVDYAFFKAYLPEKPETADSENDEQREHSC